VQPAAPVVVAAKPAPSSPAPATVRVQVSQASSVKGTQIIRVQAPPAVSQQTNVIRINASDSPSSSSSAPVTTVVRLPQQKSITVRERGSGSQVRETQEINTGSTVQVQEMKTGSSIQVQESKGRKVSVHYEEEITTNIKAKVELTPPTPHKDLSATQDVQVVTTTEVHSEPSAPEPVVSEPSVESIVETPSETPSEPAAVSIAAINEAESLASTIIADAITEAVTQPSGTPAEPSLEPVVVEPSAIEPVGVEPVAVAPVAVEPEAIAEPVDLSLLNGVPPQLEELPSLEDMLNHLSSLPLQELLYFVALVGGASLFAQMSGMTPTWMVILIFFASIVIFHKLQV